MSTNKFRLGEPVIRFSSGSTSIGMLVGPAVYGAKDYEPWAARMLGRFPIPAWQRELVWTENQNRAFIKSVFEGYNLGSVMINDWEELPSGNLRPMSDILIDGQQRINSLILFSTNKFDYLGYYWDDLNRIEKRRFLEAEVGLYRTRCFDEEILKTAYNHLNFSGTAHQESERAS